MIQRIQDAPWSFAVALFVTLFGPWHAWMGILIILILIDYASGFLAGCATGTCDSNLAKKGVYKKLGMGLAIAFAHQLDAFMYTSDAWTKAILGLLIASESWSITENFDDLGVPMPEALKQKIKQLRSNNPRKRNRSKCRGGVNETQ
jgi:toxin secretion/phage lysis holin